MNPNRIPPILWVFPLALMTLACPTRTVPPDGGDHGDAGDDADSGRSRDSGADRPSAGGAGGIRGTGGAGGIGGVGGTGGSAGTGGGSGLGGVGAGGVAGIAGTVRDGQPCALSKDCTSGACTPFYVDVDNDGYGAGQAIGFCGTTPPVGYSAQSGDCCDSASNLAFAKLIHPGADFQTTSAGGVCNITWDYDCSGIVESNPQTVACGQTYPACTTTIVDLAESFCGTGYEDTCSCGGRGDGTTGACFTNCGGHPPITVGCR
jgi:hypothetical protein